MEGNLTDSYAYPVAAAFQSHHKYGNLPNTEISSHEPTTETLELAHLPGQKCPKSHKLHLDASELQDKSHIDKSYPGRPSPSQTHRRGHGKDRSTPSPAQNKDNVRRVGGGTGNSPPPANGEMGGVDPSGEAGGVLAALLGDEGYPAGRLIMMLRVTFIGASSPPAGVVGGITVVMASGTTSERTHPTRRKQRTASQIHGRNKHLAKGKKKLTVL